MIASLVPRPSRSPANIIRAIIYLVDKKIIARIMFAGKREGLGTRLMISITIIIHVCIAYPQVFVSGHNVASSPVA